MLYNRTRDIIFILVIVTVSLFFLIRLGSSGLSLAIWLILMPLYIFRIIVWSNWDYWKRKIHFHATPRLWMGTVFVLWTLSALLQYQVRDILSIRTLVFHPLFSAGGFLIALAGLLLTMWTLWLLGLERAVLTTLIFGETKPEQKKIIKHGPYAVTPHPMFLGESLIIAGTFFFSGEISLLLLLLFSITANMVAARGEERDLKRRAGEEYSGYLEKGKFILSSWKKQKEGRINRKDDNL